MVNLKLIAAGTAAAAALTGCSQTDAGSAARPSLSLTATEMHSQWVGAADRRWRSDLPAIPDAAQGPQDRTAGPLQLGSPILQPLSDIRAEICSAGAWFTDPAGGSVMLAAGHCDKTPGEAVSIAPRPGASRGELVAIGEYANETLDDTALLRLNNGVTPASDSAVVGGRWPVSGVLDTATAASLPPTVSVCVVGAKLGLQCGRLMLTSEDSALVDLPSRAENLKGNSGGSAWLIDDTDRAVLLGSIVEASTSPASTTLTVRYAAPLVRDLNLKIVEGQGR